jgi:hypothetical protein
VRFIAKLVTDRPLERSVQKFAPDQINAEGVAREYLQANGCEPGDSFDIHEIKPVHVSTLFLNKDGSVEKK